MMRCPRCGGEMELEKIRRVIDLHQIKTVRIWRCSKCSFQLEEEIIDVRRVEQEVPVMWKTIYSATR